MEDDLQIRSHKIFSDKSTLQIMWPDLIKRAKEGGLDVIQTYVFWDGHEPTQGQYYFKDRYDLVRFIKVVKEAGLYVHLRIGPYICAEWNFGGFPVWLKYIPGISFRTDNGPFKAEMEKFTSKIVSMMKAERLFEPQGGPIILSQIENEYGTYYDEPSGKSYISWAAKMAVGLDTKVPWIMCKQDDAPDPIVNACNAFYCDNFYPIRKYTPKVWTEAWTGWLSGFGQAIPYRPVEDIAFAVARFIQKSGSFINYYMYHGGTNFGRTAGGPLLTTSYDYDAPIDEYGLLRNPKWGHLRDLHKAVKQCEPSLISGDPVVTSLGKNLESSVFRSNSSCAAFLANFDSNSSARVKFNGLPYDLPAWSVSILPDCKTVVFNTAKVTDRKGEGKMVPIGGFSWKSYKESTDKLTDNPFTKNWLVEQLSMTWDKTDYLWYTTYVDIAKSENFLKAGKYPTLTVASAGHALHVFINGKYTGSSYGTVDEPRLTYTGSANLVAGSNKIFLLSVAQGLPNVGHHYETWNVGVLGPVKLSGLNEGTRDLSKQKWTYQVGLHGEAVGVYTAKGSSKVKWDGVAQKQPLTWYKATFNAPKGNEPLALDMNSMAKGQIWINGQNVGRYWPSNTAKGSCNKCDYRGTYDENKCRYSCGGPTQRWYHVPRSWLKPTDNLLVVLEELGGDPSGITLVKRV